MFYYCFSVSFLTAPGTLSVKRIQEHPLAIRRLLHTLVVTRSVWMEVFFPRKFGRPLCHTSDSHRKHFLTHSIPSCYSCSTWQRLQKKPPHTVKQLCFWIENVIFYLYVCLSWFNSCTWLLFFLSPQAFLTVLNFLFCRHTWLPDLLACSAFRNNVMVTSCR